MRGDFWQGPESLGSFLIWACLFTASVLNVFWDGTRKNDQDTGVYVLLQSSVPGRNLLQNEPTTLPMSTFDDRMTHHHNNELILSHVLLCRCF